eukprot:1142264-Lingulodinium_polyedra.AAC.1
MGVNTVAFEKTSSWRPLEMPSAQLALDSTNSNQKSTSREPTNKCTVATARSIAALPAAPVTALRNAV